MFNEVFNEVFNEIDDTVSDNESYFKQSIIITHKRIALSVLLFLSTILFFILFRDSLIIDYHKTSLTEIAKDPNKELLEKILEILNKNGKE